MVRWSNFRSGGGKYVIVVLSFGSIVVDRVRDVVVQTRPIQTVTAFVALGETFIQLGERAIVRVSTGVVEGASRNILRGATLVPHVHFR